MSGTRPFQWERPTSDNSIYRRVTVVLYKADLGPIGWDIAAIDESQTKRLYIHQPDGRVYFVLMSVFRALAVVRNIGAGDQYFLAWKYWARVHL